MPWKTLISLSALCVCLGAATFHFRNAAVESNQRLAASTEALKRSEAVVRDMGSAAKRADKVSQEHVAATGANNTEGEKRVEYITKVVSVDSCARAVVPAAAAERLRQHRDAIRARASTPH